MDELCPDCGLPNDERCICASDNQGVPFFSERCETHPDHQNGMVTYAMIEARLHEEVADLRAALFKAREKIRLFEQESQR